MASVFPSGSLTVSALPWAQSAASTSSNPTLMSLSLCSATTVRTAGFLRILSRARRCPFSPEPLPFPMSTPVRRRNAANLLR